MFYRLPWADRLSVMFTQAPGRQGHHALTKATLHAVDIAMPEGVAVLAARAMDGPACARITGFPEVCDARHDVPCAGFTSGAAHASFCASNCS